MGQDLAYRLDVSQATVIKNNHYMDNFFCMKLYPTTRVIIDATEIIIEQPHLLELQQMSFKGLDWNFTKWSNHIHIQALPWLNIRQTTYQRKWSD